MTSNAQYPDTKVPKSPPAGKRKRVVPDSQRRRTAVSCDRCKLRRARCIRSSPAEECSNCVTAGLKCESTLPRKHRVYGSLESLSMRYRALDALVKGLLPGEDVENVESLMKLGSDRGIGMPNIDDQSTLHPEIFGNVQPSPTFNIIDNVSGAPDHPSERTSNPFLGPPDSKPREEKLIPAPHGVGHYVGPSSSLGFAALVRKMVAQCSSDPLFMLSQSQLHRFQVKALRADFITLKVSKALEPRDGTIDRDDESLDGRSESYASSQSPNILDAWVYPRRGSTPPDFLPSRATADALVQAFFDYVHPNYPLFHRTIFQLRYESLWDSSKDPSKELEPGWLACMCLIFVFGAQSLEPHDKIQAMLLQRRYLNIARSFVDQLVSTTSLQNIQALLLLQLYYHNIGERNASWMFLGCASRMAIALGMHREGANVGFDTLERNIRKTVWWTLYIFERNLCIILGRPSAIEEDEISITFPDEAIESSMGLPNLTAAMATLNKISFCVKQQMFSPSDLRSANDEAAVASAARKLLQELQNWKESLPPHLRVGWNAVHSHQSRAIRLLDMLYHHTQTLITRPFLINCINSDIDFTVARGKGTKHVHQVPKDVRQLSHLCVTAAENVLSQAKMLIKDGLLNGTSWLDVYYVYHACFILCLEPIAHPADQPEPVIYATRKEAVRSTLVVVREMPLAPTYRTLVHVASQFASLVGALGDIQVETTDESQGIAVEQRNGDANMPRQPKDAAYPASPAKSYTHPHPATETAPPLNTNPRDWVAAATLPWDFLGRTPYGQSQGFSNDWYATQAGTWDDMMFPNVVGGTFGHGPFRGVDPGLGAAPGMVPPTDDWAVKALGDPGRGFA